MYLNWEDTLEIKQLRERGYKVSLLKRVNEQSIQLNFLQHGQAFGNGLLSKFPC